MSQLCFVSFGLVHSVPLTAKGIFQPCCPYKAGQLSYLEMESTGCELGKQNLPT